MDLLLDTHILLWGLLEPTRLRPQTARELESPGNVLWVSPISTWETMVLADKGRIALQPDAAAWLRRVFRTLPFKEAPLNHEVAIRSRTIDWDHRDPADRFLAATALVYDLTLVSTDAQMRHVPGLSLVVG